MKGNTLVQLGSDSTGVIVNTEKGPTKFWSWEHFKRWVNGGRHWCVQCRRSPVMEAHSLCGDCADMNERHFQLGNGPEYTR